MAKTVTSKIPALVHKTRSDTDDKFHLQHQPGDLRQKAGERRRRRRSTNDPEGQGYCAATRAARTRAACYIVVREEGGARRWGQQGRYMRAPRWEACLQSKCHPHLRANKRV